MFLRTSAKPHIQTEAECTVINLDHRPRADGDLSAPVVFDGCRSAGHGNPEAEPNHVPVVSAVKMLYYKL